MEKEIGENYMTENVTNKIPLGYIEDNNLKIFLDETIDLEEVVSEVQDNLSKEDTNEINLNE